MLVWLKLGAGALAGAVLLSIVSYQFGKSAGRSEARHAALEATIETLRERKLTDEKVQSMDDAGLCAALGGLLKDGRCE